MDINYHEVILSVLSETCSNLNTPSNGRLGKAADDIAEQLNLLALMHKKEVCAAARMELARDLTLLCQEQAK